MISNSKASMKLEAVTYHSHTRVFPGLVDRFSSILVGVRYSNKTWGPNSGRIARMTASA